MPILAIIISGIVGTLVMTGIIFFISLVNNKAMKVPRLLGTLITFSTTPDGGLCRTPRCLSIGTMAHYGMGILFVFCYYLLWQLGIGKPTVLYALIFGAFHGILAVLIWWLFFKVHPHPPTLNLPDYLLSILVGHLFFALSGIICFNMINQLINIGEIQP